MYIHSLVPALMKTSHHVFPLHCSDRVVLHFLLDAVRCARFYAADADLFCCFCICYSSMNAQNCYFNLSNLAICPFFCRLLVLRHKNSYRIAFWTLPPLVMVTIFIVLLAIFLKVRDCAEWQRNAIMFCIFRPRIAVHMLFVRSCS